MTIPFPGTVYLTGAGPGHPELLTVRAHDLITAADTVLHDDLVPRSILQLCRSDAQIVSVGKRCGSRAITQEQINRFMIAAARAGQSVVRLKCGDPMLYGRASEELAALEQEGIPCEVVPGVSAAFAAAAGLGVSLTDRSASSKLIILTGHRAATPSPSPLWQGDLPLDATIAIYMPGTDYQRAGDSLLDSGLPLDTPCVAVSRAGTEQQQSLRTTLAELSAHDPLPPPCVILVGRALGLHTQEIADQMLAGVSNFLAPSAFS